jgi:predicted permease
MAIRTALGALPGRLARLLLTESLLIAAAGGLLGVALAYAGLRVLPLLDGGTLPRVDQVGVNTTVLAISALASMASGLLFGFAPLLVVWRGALDAVLKAGVRGGRGGAPSQRARRALVVAEIALSVMLLIGAGLLIRTFINLYGFYPGFRSSHVLTFRISLPGDRYRPKGIPVPVFVDQLERELGAVPGVQAIGAINQLPLDDDPNYAIPYWTLASPPEERTLADTRLVSPGYLPAVGAELVAGRWFTREDDETHPFVVIVDERLARQAWPGQDPIGQELQVESHEDGPRGRVVGVIRHVRQHRISEEVREELFAPFAQRARNQLSVAVRAVGDPLTLVPALTERLHGIDPNLSPSRVQPLGDLVARSRAPNRFSMVLTTLFAAFSLMLACLSQYGVISYSVAQRTLEFGVRSALGARGSDLVRMMTRQGLALSAAGIVLGMVGALVTAASLRTLLFGVSAFDPLTFIGVPLLVGAIAVLACYLPARRAARIDPMTALRSE